MVFRFTRRIYGRPPVQGRGGAASLSEEQMAEWKEVIASYFKGGFGGRRDNYSDIAVEAILTMKLAG